jgi:hypothetical protein
MLLNILLSVARFDKPGRVVQIKTDLLDGLSIVIQDIWCALIDSLKLILAKALIERHSGRFSIVSTPNDRVAVRLSFPPSA